jgi:hypothetical protein
VAVKLSLLQNEAGELQAAKSVLAAAKRVAADAHSHANRARAGTTSERFCHITASRSQRSDATMELCKDLSEPDQVLAHLHADATQLLFRVELDIGMQEARAAADKAAAKATAKLERRRQQVRDIADCIPCWRCLACVKQRTCSALDPAKP